MNSKITKALLIATLLLNTFTIPVNYPQNYKRDGLSLDIGIGDEEVVSTKTVPSDLLDSTTKTLPSKNIPEEESTKTLPSKSIPEEEQSTKTLPSKSIPTETKSVPDTKSVPNVHVDSNDQPQTTKTLPCHVGIDLPESGSKTVPPEAGSKTVPAVESKTVPPAAEPKTIPPSLASKTVPVDVPTSVKTIPVSITEPTQVPPEQAEGGNSSNGGSDDSDSISGTNVPVDDNNSEDEDNGADAASGQADDIPNSSDIEYDDIASNSNADTGVDDIPNSSDIEYDDSASGSNADAGSDDIPNSSDVESDGETDTSNVQISTDDDQDVDVAEVSPTTKTIPPAAEAPVEAPVPVPDTPENSEEEGIAGSSADAGNASEEEGIAGSSADAGNASEEEGIAGSSADAGNASEEEGIDSADILNSSDLEYDQIELKDGNDVDENEAPVDENEAPVETPEIPASLPPKTLPNDTSSTPSSPSSPASAEPSAPAEVGISDAPGLPGLSSVQGQSTKDIPSSLPPKDISSTKSVPTSNAIDEEINIDIEVPFIDALGFNLPGIGGSEEPKKSDNENVLNGDSGFTVPKPGNEEDKKDGAPIQAPDLKNPKDLSQSEYEDYLKDVNNNIESPLNFEVEDAAEDSAF